MVGMDELSLIVQSLPLLTRERYASNGTQTFGPLRHWCNAFSSFDLNVLEKPSLGVESSWFVTMAVLYKGNKSSKQQSVSLSS